MSTKQLRASIQSQIGSMKRELELLERQLKTIESQCKHRWGPTEEAHIRHEGYTEPGDPPGTMGIDWRGPIYVEPRIQQRWSRECLECGLVEYTTQSTTVVNQKPKFY